MIAALQRRHGHTAIALAGGCAYNSVANGKIKERTAYKETYLQSAAGDAGGAIGAAYAVWHRAGARSPVMSHAFWCPGFSDAELSGLLVERAELIKAEGCQIQLLADENGLLHAAARAIADGLVVGWFQGRMGVRAPLATARFLATPAAPT
jgi:carbamoyltransferase